MKKHLIIPLLLICMQFWGCSKSGNSENGPSSTGTTQIKIQLVSGGGQTDTIGNPLKNPFIVQVTKNGSPAAGYSVTFQGPGCSQTDPLTLVTQQNGETGINWSLTGDIGQQTLKAYVLDVNKNKIDSVAVTATAVAAGPGWHNGGCSLQSDVRISGLCKLSTGRMFVSYENQNYLRYSDDNGVNWYAVTALGNTHQVMRVISTTSDELLAFTSGTDGTFYSNNAGQSWTNIGVPPFNALYINGIVYSPDGQLLVTSRDIGVSMSLDKGKTWTTVPPSIFTPSSSSAYTLKDPCIDKNDNFYVVNEENNVIYRSADMGKTWSDLQPDGNTGATGEAAFYIDNNNNFYIFTLILEMGILTSKDAGATYQELVRITPFSATIDNMSLQSDGRFYFEDVIKGLYVVNSGSASAQLVFPFLSSVSLPYLVAKNNSIIIENNATPYVRYYIK